MKWTISRDALLQALTRIQSVIEKKNTLEILGNTLFQTTGNQLVLCGTDLEVGMQITLPAEVSEEGKLTLSTKSILDITKELPNQPMHFSRKANQWVELTCGRARFNLLSLPADTYPSLPAFETKTYTLADSDRLANMIDRTQFAVSTDATRFHMNGVFLEMIEGEQARMVATDGHRLSVVDQKLFATTPDLKRGIIIPKKGLTEIRKLLNGTKTIQLSFERGSLYAKSEEVYLSTRLIEAEYVPYRQVIPSDLNAIATTDRDEMLHALKRVSLMAHEKSRGVKFTFAPGLLTIASSNPEMGEAKDELNIEYTGETIEIGFNSRYLLDCLEVMTTPKIQIRLKDKTKAGIVQAENDESHTYVIMPMRI
jgi:DNA polymerase III subunit beta